MSYAPLSPPWANGSAGGTALDATRFDHMDDGIKEASDRLDVVEPAVAAKTVVSVDGTPVSTFAVNTTPVTAEDVGAAPAQAAGVRLYALSTNQALTNLNATQINLTNIEYNDDTSFYTVDLTANTITVLRAGLYLAGWSVKFAGGSAGQRYSSVSVNGSIVREAGSKIADATAAASARGSDSIRLAAGAVVDLRAYVDGGAGVTVAGAFLYETGLSLAFLGE